MHPSEVQSLTIYFELCTSFDGYYMAIKIITLLYLVCVH